MGKVNIEEVQARAHAFLDAKEGIVLWVTRDATNARCAVLFTTPIEPTDLVMRLAMLHLSLDRMKEGLATSMGLERKQLDKAIAMAVPLVKADIDDEATRSFTSEHSEGGT